MSELLILTEGGGSIGLGHIMRCTAIKNAWSFGTSTLMVDSWDETCISSNAIHFDWRERINEICVKFSNSTRILVDSYQVDKKTLLRLKQYFSFVSILDDFNRIDYPVDLVICPGVYGKQIDYKQQTAITVGGPEYVILRQDIIAARKERSDIKLRSILVCFGGSQPNEQLYQQIINIFSDAHYNLTVVTGNDLLASKLQGKADIYGKLDAIEMTQIMASTDVAICAAGQTLNEFAWLGIPVIVFKTTEDQYPNWSFYQQQNYLLSACLPNELDLEQKILSQLESLSVQYYKQLSKKLKKLLTAFGAENVCSIIKKEASEANE